MKNSKHFLATLIIFFFSDGFAQENYKKAVVTNTINIEGDINFAWTFLSNLGNLEKLIPSTIEKSTLVGNGKGSVVNLKLSNNKGTIVEKVVKLNNEKRRMTYAMLSTPLPIKSYFACFKLSKIDDHTFEVQFQARFKVQDKNRKTRIDAFNSLQVELLTNLKKITNGINQ